MFSQQIDYFHYQSDHIRNKIMCIISTLRPVHIQSFIKLAYMVFELSRDPYVLQHFDYFRYHRNHIFHARAKYLHNQHNATCSHAKFHQASLNSFCVISGSRFQQTDRQTEGKPIVGFSFSLKINLNSNWYLLTNVLSILHLSLIK